MMQNANTTHSPSHLLSRVVFVASSIGLPIGSATNELLHVNLFNLYSGVREPRFRAIEKNCLHNDLDYIALLTYSVNCAFMPASLGTPQLLRDDLLIHIL